MMTNEFDFSRALEEAVDAGILLVVNGQYMTAGEIEKAGDVMDRDIAKGRGPEAEAARRRLAGK